MASNECESAKQFDIASLKFSYPNTVDNSRSDEEQRIESAKNFDIASLELSYPYTVDKSSSAWKQMTANRQKS